MINNFDQNDRRILNFPAIHPCESISPGTLLESLVTLSRKISNYQTRFFATQRKNSKQAIRQVGILLMFLEELQESRIVLPGSINLCFSELHLTFQRILFLLDDITREGARIWVLMKAHFVASQFLILVRSVATALDVLEMDSIRVSSEIRELVELVAIQARRVRLELDFEDEEVMKKVIVIINQFENRFEPDQGMIKGVLDYLGIRRWDECHKEVKFLEELSGLMSLDGNEREMPLISSLAGLMRYSRGVIFANSGFGEGGQVDGRGNVEVEVVSFLNLEDFRCPISLELMTDPVTVSTGQTYDRASIQKWFKSGNLICPKTGERLETTELVANSSLRKIIQQFCADHGVSLAKTRKKNSDISRTIVPGSPAAAEAIRFLSGFLSSRLSYGTDEQKMKAAHEVRLLGKSSIFNRYCLIEAGTVPPLLTLLASSDSPTQENAISAILKLSKHSKGKKQIIENEGLNLIVNVLKKGLKLEARQTAAATIFYLSSVDKYRKMLGETTEAIPALVELIKEGTNCGKKNAVVAIFGLLLYPRNHHRVLAAGTVQVLTNLLSNSDKKDVITDSLAILAKLSESFEGSSMIVQASALSIILRIFKNLASRSGKEYCASILLSLCHNCGADVISVLAKDPGLMTALYSLLSDVDGTAHSNKKARMIINIVHRFHETSTSQMINHQVQEQSIHVQ
ncbi:hypothetical protein ACET3Z_027302 [Daucus carota]